MTLRFADGFEIEVPKKGSVVEFLFRHHPNRVSEYCNYLTHQQNAFRYIDFFLRQR